MKETAKCPECGNLNEIKVSTGHKNPENKGKRYTLCASCNKFQWVEGLATPEEVKATEKAYDSEARGKVKCAIVTAVINYGGLEALKGQMEKINKVVDYVMEN